METNDDEIMEITEGGRKVLVEILPWLKMAS